MCISHRLQVNIILLILISFPQQASGKPVSQLRLKCKAGIATGDPSVRNGSVFNSSSLDLDQQINQLSAKVTRLYYFQMH